MTSLTKVRVAGCGFQTSDGAPFVPFGVNYYRPGTGWAPQVWQRFDEDATRRDFERLHELGANCVRVFLTLGSFCPAPGEIDAEGLLKFERFVALAEAAELYVHPTGPDHWEGTPGWAQVDHFADDGYLSALESFWHTFGARFGGHPAIFAYDLLNEPGVSWDSPVMAAKFGRPIPDATAAPSELLAYQHFRESLADRWTQRQADAIREADPEALVTVGLIQWSVPVLLPRLEAYSAFNPARIERYLDFLEIHFYPLDPLLEYVPGQAESNLAYLESLVRVLVPYGKPVVIAEYGWYGGGSFADHPEASEEDQATWCSALVRSTEPFVSGWLNWGFHDQPEARDVSVLTGLLRADGTPKAWARCFQELATDLTGAPGRPCPARDALDLDWDACTVSLDAGHRFREAYRHAYRQNARSLDPR